MAIVTADQSLVYGIHPILELLRAKRRTLRMVYTTRPEPQAWGQIRRLLPAHVPISYVTRDQLAKMAGTTDHQGVVAQAAPFQFRKKPFDPKRSPFLIALDGIQDPRNLGAIIRSAYCTGVDGIIISRKQSAPLNAVALKSSAGLAEHIEICEVASLAPMLQELKKAGYANYIAALGGKDVRQTAFTQPLCIVIGSEGVGVSAAVLAQGERVMLPQKTADISYNASVAAGVLLFTIAVQINRI
jgi:23S rRNA (guanosine2251-2'-O)-methyltransferase